MSRFSCFLLATVLLFVGCKNTTKYSYLQDKPISVRVMVASDSEGVSVRNYIGEISSASEIPLQFALGGELEELNIRNGQKVKKGDVLARVDATQAESMYESAKAVLAQAEDGYNRIKPVYEKGGVSEVKWKAIETDVQKARSVYASSEKRYRDCTLRAPQDGVIQMKNVEVGYNLAPSQPIGLLLDMKHLTALFTVPENEVGRMQVGQQVSVVVPSLELTLQARIKDKDMVSTRLAHTYDVTASLIDSEEIDRLLPGMVCKVSVSNSQSKGIVIPAVCVVTQKQGLSVWVLRNGRAERQLIEVSEYLKNGVMVSNGLAIGDTIVVQGYQKLFNGANVQIIE